MPTSPSPVIGCHRLSVNHIGELYYPRDFRALGISVRTERRLIGSKYSIELSWLFAVVFLVERLRHNSHLPEVP